MLTICGRNDGHNYSDATQSGDTVITFYSTSNNNTPNNAYGWVDINSIAYSIISRGFQYVPGDKLDGTIKDSVDKYIGNIEDQLVPEAEVRLAQQYDLVVGDKFQLFYLGVVKTFNIDNLGLNCVCVKGKAYPRYWEFEPTASDVGEYDLTIQCRRLDGSMISTGKTKIIVHPIPVFDAPTTKNILMFGDSLTSSGCWCSEGVRRLVGTNDEGASGPASLRIANLTINSIGNKTNTNNFYTIHHEGYGGWTWNSFLSPANTGSTVNGIIVTLAAPHGYEIDNVQKSIWVDNNGKNWELEDLPSDTTIKFNRGSGNNQEQSQTSLPTSMTCSSPSLNITVQSAE